MTLDGVNAAPSIGPKRPRTMVAVPLSSFVSVSPDVADALAGGQPFVGYLARYPNGRFAKEAADRLARVQR